MKKPSGRFEVLHRSGRVETLHFKTLEGKDYKELVKDLDKAKEIGSVTYYKLILGKERT